MQLFAAVQTGFVEPPLVAATDGGKSKQRVFRRLLILGQHRANDGDRPIPRRLGGCAFFRLRNSRENAHLNRQGEGFTRPLFLYFINAFEQFSLGDVLAGTDIGPAGR